MPSKTKILGHQWSFAKLWNDAAASIPQRPLQKRDYLYASELGLSFIDRYLKMHAFPYTNPPNERSRRKFISGEIWEWLVSVVLTICGILKHKQLKSEVQLPGQLRVSGRLDFIAGGIIDWDKARFELRKLQDLFALTSGNGVPPFVLHASTVIIDKLYTQFKNKPLKEIILENKAISSFMAEKLEKTGKALPHNVLQCCTYMIANNMDAKLNYVCKDDNIMQEFEVASGAVLLKFYRTDVETMTGWYNASNFKNPLKTMPPKEPEVLFDESMYRFEKNFSVEYSSYLEFLYGYKSPEAFRLRWQKSVGEWNRVFKRCARGEKITDANKKILNEVIKVFPAWDKYVYRAKSVGAFLKPEDNE